MKIDHAQVEAERLPPAIVSLSSPHAYIAAAGSSSQPYPGDPHGRVYRRLHKSSDAEPTLHPLSSVLTPIENVAGEQKESTCGCI